MQAWQPPDPPPLEEERVRRRLTASDPLATKSGGPAPGGESFPDNKSTKPDGGPDDSNQRVVRDAGKMSGATGISHLITLVGTIILPKFLSPQMLGIWRTVQLSLQYCQYLNLGISYGLQKIGPSLLVSGRQDRYSRLLSACVGFSLIPTLIASATLIAMAFVLGGGLEVPLLALSLLVLFNQLFHFGEVTLAVEKRFGPKATILFSYTAVRVPLTLLAAYFLQLPGVLAVFVLTLGFAAFANLRASGARIRPVLHLPITKRLLGHGITITMMQVGELVLTTADRWVVGSWMGMSAMGLYGIALLPQPILLLLPMQLRFVAQIEVYERFLRTRNPKDVEGIQWHSLDVLTLTAPLIFGAAFIGGSWVVARFLPHQYYGAIGPLQMFTLLLYPVLLVQTGTAYFIVFKQERPYFLTQLAVAVVSTACTLLYISMQGERLEPVLMIHGTGWLVFAVIQFLWLGRLLGKTLSESLGTVLRYFMPGIAIVIELPLLFRMLDRLGFHRYSLGETIVASVIHVAFCIPFLWLLEKRTGLLSKAAGAVLRRLR